MPRLHSAVPFHALHDHARVAALAAALVLLPACSLLGGGDALSTMPVSSTAPGTDERAAAAEAALAAASQAWRDGDALAAMSIATRALHAGAPPEHETRLRRIRARARETLLSEQVVQLTVLPTLDAVADGSDVAGVVRFQNRSSAPVGVDRTAEDSSESLVILDVTRRDYDVYGNVRVTEFTVHVPLGRDLELAPGARAEVPFAIRADDTRLTHTGFATLEIRGQLRAVAIRVGATEFFDALPLEPAVVRVFQRGYEPLAEDPMGSLVKAVAKRSPPHILIAAELLAPGERARGVELLNAAADDDPPLAFVCKAAVDRLNDLLAGGDE